MPVIRSSAPESERDSAYRHQIPMSAGSSARRQPVWPIFVLLVFGMVIASLALLNKAGDQSSLGGGLARALGMHPSALSGSVKGAASEQFSLQPVASAGISDEFFSTSKGGAEYDDVARVLALHASLPTPASVGFSEGVYEAWLVSPESTAVEPGAVAVAWKAKEFSKSLGTLHEFRTSSPRAALKDYSLERSLSSDDLRQFGEIRITLESLADIADPRPSLSTVLRGTFDFSTSAVDEPLLKQSLFSGRVVTLGVGRERGADLVDPEGLLYVQESIAEQPFEFSSGVAGIDEQAVVVHVIAGLPDPSSVDKPNWVYHAWLVNTRRAPSFAHDLGALRATGGAAPGVLPAFALDTSIEGLRVDLFDRLIVTLEPADADPRPGVLQPLSGNL